MKMEAVHSSKISEKNKARYMMQKLKNMTTVWLTLFWRKCQSIGL